MRDDFDAIEGTFKDINDALQEIGLLDGTLRERDKFTERLIAVLISFLKFCWFSRKMFQEKGYSRKRKPRSYDM